MPHLSAFITDTRYSVPTLRLDLAVEPGREPELAGRLIGESPFYTAVELRNAEGEVVLVQRRDGDVAVPAAGPNW